METHYELLHDIGIPELAQNWPGVSLKTMPQILSRLYGWSQRNSIPSTHWIDLMDAAHKAGRNDISADLLLHTQ